MVVAKTQTNGRPYLRNFAVKKTLRRWTADRSKAYRFESEDEGRRLIEAAHPGWMKDMASFGIPVVFEEVAK